MKLRFLVPALALALTTIAAHAQVGLYFNPVVSRISNSKADTGPFAFLGDGQTSQIFGGVDFGGYYEFGHYSKADVSIQWALAVESNGGTSLPGSDGFLAVSTIFLASFFRLFRFARELMR